MPRHPSFTPKGVIPAVILPFKADLSIDEAAFRKHLAQVVAHLTQNGPGLKLVTLPSEQDAIECAEPSLDDVRGLSGAKTALAVAAAGGHGLLFIGPPGAGKSMLARRLTRLLPAPTLQERMEITRVLSAAGRWPAGHPNMSWQMITEAITPTRSAMRPAATAWRARRTATEPK